MHAPAHLTQRLLAVAVVLSQWATPATADCNAYSPAYPLPVIDAKSSIIRQAQQEITHLIHDLVDDNPSYNTTSYSIAVTSSTETLFDLHRTASVRDPLRPGAPENNGSTGYRIASCTKTFTVLALLQQHKLGTIDSLDDPIIKYVAALNDPDQLGTLPWKDITLRTLASQLSGIPRDLAQSDLLTELPDPVGHGLPPLDSPEDHHEQNCDSITNYTIPCTAENLLSFVKSALPIFPPKQQSTYSNLGFELLSLALANVTSTPYETLIHETILTPLNLTSTTFTPPPDSRAALPKDDFWYWDYLLGIQNPTGGLYSTSDDLASFLRHALTTYNGLSPAVNWFHPVSPATGAQSWYGMPWEIFRTTDILSAEYSGIGTRPVTFVTKGGALPGYTSTLALLPEFNLAFVVLVAGNSGLVADMVERVGGVLVKAADEIARAQTRAKYTGTWTHSSPKVNSTFTFSHTPERGLWVSRWISNGTSIIDNPTAMSAFSGIAAPFTDDESTYLQAVPTLLFKDEKAQNGEIWRLLGHRQFPQDKHWFKGKFCPTDIDIGIYGGLPVNEVVFWDEVSSTDDEKEGFEGLGLTGFRVRLERDWSSESVGGQGEVLAVQEEL